MFRDGIRVSPDLTPHQRDRCSSSEKRDDGVTWRKGKYLLPETPGVAATFDVTVPATSAMVKPTTTPTAETTSGAREMYTLPPS